MFRLILEDVDMMKRKVAALVCAVLVIGCSIAGCGGSDSGNMQENGADTQMAQGREPMNGMEMTMGKVTEINGNEITIALVNMPGAPGNGKMPEGKGERPEMPEGEQGERPEMPEGEQGERPEIPEGKQGERPEMPEEMFEETGETKTIVIEDESIIVKNEGGEQVAGSLADIEVDSVISLSYDEDENLTQVMIGGGRGKK